MEGADRYAIFASFFNSQEWRGRSGKSPDFRPGMKAESSLITFALCITYILHYVHLLSKVWLRLHRSEGTPELSVHSPIL